MSDLFIVVDAGVETRKFISSVLPGTTVSRQIPSNWDFQTDKTLVLFTVAGGGSMRDLVLDPVLITVDVSNKSAQVASEAARKLHAHFMTWPDSHDRVLKVKSLTRPFDYPHEDLRTPTYTFTLSAVFKAEQKPL